MTEILSRLRFRYLKFPLSAKWWRKTSKTVTDFGSIFWNFPTLAYKAFLGRLGTYISLLHPKAFQGASFILRLESSRILIQNPSLFCVLRHFPAPVGKNWVPESYSTLNCGYFGGWFSALCVLLSEISAAEVEKWNAKWTKILEHSDSVSGH